MEPTKPYRELQPGTPEHKEFIAMALLTRNFAFLAALKNRTDKTIHVVNNWFFYTIMRIEGDQDIVIIYDEKDRETINRMSNEEERN